MPRPKKVGAPEPKRRSRNGCWPCKARKVKCGEEKPHCLNCERQGETCDYSIRLNWEGRSKKKPSDGAPDTVEDSTMGFQLHRVGLGSSSSLLSFVTSGSEPAEATYQSQTYFYGGAVPGDQSSQSPSLRTDSIGRSFFGHAGPYSDPRTANVGTSSGSAMIDPSLIRQSDTPGLGYGWRESEARPMVKPTAQRSTMDSYHSGPTTNPDDESKRFGPSRTAPVQLPRLQRSYPSPNSGVPSPIYSANFEGGGTGTRVATQMLPPVNSAFQHSSNFGSGHQQGEYNRLYSPDTATKRIRLSPTDGANYRPPSFQYPRSIQNSSQSQLPHFMPHHSHNSNLHTPLTPTASVVSDEATHTHLAPTSASVQESAELRRVSVNSLLSDPAMDDGTPEPPLGHRGNASAAPSPEEYQTYGVDRGFPDLDIPKNDDANAISGMSPVAENLPMYSERGLPLEFGFGLRTKGQAFGSEGYYANPVPVKIPKALEPLPPSLLENPMNLLYFHHFLDHTARILVIHDCSQNPFKTILPQMAVENENLLNLLLAYSASHRARLLNVSEPTTRIAGYVQNVFPSLRMALSYGDPSTISDADLATAIMLASLEIISPNTFEVEVPWWRHLHTAREMILARGGAASMHRRDKVSYFLSRWFAYLDVLGALSGGKNNRPLFNGSYWTNDTSADEEDEYQIDCLLGFTTHFITILAKIADLARRCEGDRIDEKGDIRPEWQPSEDIVQAAETLKTELQAARTHIFHPCNHVSVQSDDPDTVAEDPGWDTVEMEATNDAFHWAGLVHLYRRVLGRPSGDPEVQHAVREIVGALCKVRKGGTAEACLLFPMFTAGCDARDAGQRDKIMERVRSVEKSGMTQMHKARCLMQKVWETGKPWETLVTDSHFIG